MSYIDINDREGSVERVSAEAVVRQWVEQETEEEYDDLESRSIEELVALLEDPQRLAASIFFEEDLEWYRIELTEEELRDVLVVKGPDGEGWRAVADGNDIESIARRIADADDIESLNEDVPKDVAYVRETAAEHESDEKRGSFIVVQESADEPGYLADGNHRAVAVIYHVLTGGEYDGQPAYVGLPPGTDSAPLGDGEDVDHPDI